VRLIPFVYSTVQTYVLEFGDHYFRIHTQGGTLLSGGTPIEVATPYAAADVGGIKYTQSADVMTLTHPSYPPQLLIRFGPTTWGFGPETYGSSLLAPTGVTCTARKTANYGSPAVYPPLQDQRYVVTAVSADGVSESGASAEVTSWTGTQQPGGSPPGNKLSDFPNNNLIAWSAVSGASRYNVYKNTENTGIYGFIGQTKNLNFTDYNVTADFSKTPPEQQTLFASAGDYPAAVTYHEQRKVYGGSTNAPQTLWLTRSGTEWDFRRSLPARDDDAITAKIVSREVMAIRHIVPLSDLILLTSGGEWKVSAQNAEALTPYSISVRQQSYTGASDVVPILVGNACLYIQAKGGHLRELSYQWQTQAFQSVDLSLFAPHLFHGHTILQLAFTRAPYPIIWAVRDDGVLLGCTYVPEQEVVAWHQHATIGNVESIAAVSEGDSDVLYLVAARVVGGNLVRYVERMDTRLFISLQDAVFLDSALTYTGSPVTVIYGLGYLEGRTDVVALADGVVRGPFTVAGGAITLPVAAAKVTVGLPITADLETLPLLVEQEGAAGYGWPKNIGYVSVGLYQTPKVSLGPDPARLTTISPGGLWSGQTEKTLLAGNWDHVGTLYVHHTDPTPVTLTNLAMEVSLGS
jgi:hypothetical protein